MGRYTIGLLPQEKLFYLLDKVFVHVTKYDAFALKMDVRAEHGCRSFEHKRLKT